MILAFGALLLVVAGCSEPATSGMPDERTAVRTTEAVATSVGTPTDVASTPPAATPTPAATPDVRSCTAPYPQPPFTADTVFCRDPAGLQRAVLARVVDGDTLHVLIDGVDVTVRVFGIDTAERGEPCFDEAAERLGELAADGVLLLPDERDEDSFDRLLRYLYTPDGLSIDAVLIAEGLGHAWTRDGALRDPLVELEMRARADGAGCLWR